MQGKIDLYCIAAEAYFDYRMAAEADSEKNIQNMSRKFRDFLYILESLVDTKCQLTYT